MLYLKKFRFPTRGDEESFFAFFHETCYTTKYPFHVFRYRELPIFTFEPVTIFYGTNGSGKSTILNVIAEKLGIRHRTIYNRSHFFPDYVELCDAELTHEFLDKNHAGSKIITSDDVFDHLLDVRHINAGTDARRKELFEEYAEIYREQTRIGGSQFRMQSMDDFDMLKKYDDVARGSRSRFIKRHGVRNIDEHSNGEEALWFFSEQIEENALYLLDEPENSLSAQNQIKLQKLVEDSARFFGCQFIISTHSPFFLASRGAKIYNLDETPPRVRKWTELPNMRAYHELFEMHRTEFFE